MRNTVGAMMALIAAAAAVSSPFRDWYDGRRGSHIRVHDAVVGITPMNADLMASVFLPLAFAAFVAVVSVIMLSRPLMVLSGLLVWTTSVLWMASQAGTPQGLHTDLLGRGVANAMGAGALLLVASFVVRGRLRRRARPGYEAAAKTDLWQPAGTDW
jgi:hypothetical protein